MAGEDPVRVAIRSVLAADNTLAGLASGGIHDGKAPSGTLTPYVIVSKTSGVFEHTFVDSLTWRTYLVKGVGQRKADCEAIDARCRILLDRQHLNIDGYDHISMLMDREVDYPEETNGERYDHVGTVYRLAVDRSAGS